MSKEQEILLGKLLAAPLLKKVRAAFKTGPACAAISRDEIDGLPTGCG
jgi:hypothetical protein